MTTLDPQTLASLAAQYGLGESYYDFRGKFRPFSDAARMAILQAMGAFDNSAAAAATLEARPQVRTQQEAFMDVALPNANVGTVQLHIQTESGGSVASTHAVEHLQRPAEDVYRLPLPADLPLGYHRFLVQAGGRQQIGSLIITPPRCYEPEVMQHGQRLWGLSIQLYTLRSQRNWGIGDFADLKDLIRQLSPLGGHTIGLNPLHALRPADAANISPYSPSHRSFINLLYITVTDVPEFAACNDAQAWLDEHAVQLSAARTTDRVDYLAVARLKFPVLRLLYAEFVRTQLAHNTSRARQFQSFVQAQGEALQLHALYDALDQYFSTQPGRHWGWRSWPVQYHDPDSSAVRDFAADRTRQIECFMYMQWLAATQLDEAQSLAKELGMQVGVYGDVAVGVDPNGSEVWGNRALYVDGVAVGAPPDPLALKGQDWGIPPQHPVQLAAQGYAPFVRMLRANMRSAGALRIDHVMTLCRLWWVPRGFEATDGVYMHYPLDELMKLVALESVRNQCLVIGEDLGTVPDEMRHAMQRFGMYHYKVVFFEKTRDGQFIAPHEYPAKALAVVTTHDLPPFKSWWRGDDIALSERLQLYPDAAAREQVQRDRDHDRYQLMQALARAGLWHWRADELLPEYSHALMRAMYMYAGLSQSALLVVQPEDLQGMTDPVNVPGTSTQHANWQRKLAEELPVTLRRQEVMELLRAMVKARRGEFPNA